VLQRVQADEHGIAGEQEMLRLGPSTFGILDVFPDESGRQAHLAGPIAAALMAQAADLLAEPPAIECVDVIAAKLP